MYTAYYICSERRWYLSSDFRVKLPDFFVHFAELVDCSALSVRFRAGTEGEEHRSKHNFASIQYAANLRTEITEYELATSRRLKSKLELLTIINSLIQTLQRCRANRLSLSFPHDAHRQIHIRRSTDMTHMLLKPRDNAKQPISLDKRFFARNEPGLWTTQYTGNRHHS